MRVGFLGPSGTYSNEVAAKYFNTDQVSIIPYDTIAATIEAAEKQQVDISVVPIDNSIEGPVLVTLDQLCRIAGLVASNNKHSPLRIIGEYFLSVEHCFIVNKNANLCDITNVYSHAQALGQCKTWITTNIPKATSNEVSSTAKAVQIASTNSHFASVGSKIAAKEYDMKVMFEGIQDNSFNQTRFVFITSLIESIPDFSQLFTNTRLIKRTSLFLSASETSSLPKNTLNSLSQNHNILSIHSRPIKGNTWQRAYFIDVEGEVSETDVYDGVCILGSYYTNNNQK